MPTPVTIPVTATEPAPRPRRRPTCAPGASRALALGLALLALAAAGAPPEGRARAAVRDLTVVVGGYELFAHAPDEAPAGARVTARLARGAEEALALAAATPREDGGLVLAFVSAGARRHRPVRLQGGDRIALARDGAAPGTTRVLEVPALTAAVRAEGTLAGTAPPGTALTVTAADEAGRFARWPVTAAADGTWSVDPGAAFSVTPGASGAAFYAADDVLWQASWTARRVRTEAAEDPAHAAALGMAPWAVGATALALRLTVGEWAVATVRGADGAWRAGGAATAWSGGGSETRLLLRDADGAPAPLLPGDLVRVAFADGTAEAFRLPALGEVVLPAEGERVSGTAAPGAEVRVWPLGAPEPVAATADAEGRWAVVLADGAAAAGVDVLVAAPGAVLLRRRAHAWGVDDADPLAAAVTGRGLAGAAAALVLRDAQGAERGRAAGRVDAEGRFALAVPGPDGAAQGLAAGDALALEPDGPAGEALAWLAAPVRPVARAGRGEIEGTAAAGAVVTVLVGPESRAATAGPDGRWRVDFGDAAELGPGTPVDVVARAPGGPPQQLTFPVFRASAQSEGARVRIEGPPGLVAEVEVSREGALLAEGGCAVARDRCDAWLAAADGAPVALRPGDEVLVLPSEGATAAVEVVELAAHIDRSGSDVAGAAPPNEPVRIVFTAPPGRVAPRDTVIGADATGVFDHELQRVEWELLAPGILADVYYTLPDGHQVFNTAVVEQAWLTAGAARLGGLAEPGAPISVALHRDGALVAMGTGRAASDAVYEVALLDAAGAPVVLAAGDVVDLADGRRTARLTVPPLVVWPAEPWAALDEGPRGPDGAVVGWSSPERPVRLERRVGAAPGAPDVAVTAGVVDAFGTFALPGAEAAPGALRAARAILTLPGGDEARAEVLDAAGRVALPVGWR